MALRPQKYIHSQIQFKSETIVNNQCSHKILACIALLPKIEEEDSYKVITYYFNNANSIKRAKRNG